jgi:uncharacterized protein (DUF885 family)
MNVMARGCSWMLLGGKGESMGDLKGRWAGQAGVAAAGAILILCCMSSTARAAADGGQMRSVVEHFSADRMSLMRTFGLPLSPDRMARMETFYADELVALKKLDFDAMSEEDKVDYLLLQNRITSDVHQLSIEKKQAEEMTPLLPFAKTIVDLDASRRRMEVPNPEKAAGQLAEMTKEIAATEKQVQAKLPGHGQGAAGETSAREGGLDKVVANRAVAHLRSLDGALNDWFTFYNGYDPTFTWWVGEPYKEADKALKGYSAFLKEKVIGIAADDKTTIIGDPVGRDALTAELADNMIPYTPEELISIAQTEMDWCMKEMLKASNEMGYGNDWHKALEHVKTMHVEPGQQPELIRKLVVQGIDFAEKDDLVTVPELAKETWRMEMMSPERQLVNPFFTGGPIISISFPTDTMTYEQREMSMRGNNIPFAHATAFHEMIPGHFLQSYMGQRYRPYRRAFGTPFWSEGNAFYWEMVYWNKGFDGTPEERVGALFWRMHRSARVMFTMRFHLGEWTPKQCVDFLIESVGHEPDNATAEVRRSFDGSVGPLYQCAYLMGALQFRALHKELVDSGKMTDRQFHDAILHENEMPIEMLRAVLTQQKLTRDFKTSWKFYGLHPGSQPAQP